MISDRELSVVLGTWNCMDRSKTTIEIEPETHRPLLEHKIAQYERGKDPYLVFKNVPPSLNVEILINLCSAFGKVLRARQHEQFNMFFVNFATLNDLLNVLSGLKVNPFGITIELGKTVIYQQTNQAINNQRGTESIPQGTATLNDNQQNSKDKIKNHWTLNKIQMEDFMRPLVQMRFGQARQLGSSFRRCRTLLRRKI